MAWRCAAVLVGVAALAGCQQQPAALDPIPLPNLDGPVVLAPEPAPTPVINAAPTTRPTQVSAKLPEYPAGWLPPVAPNPWQWIVIHHSATNNGCAESFDRIHRQKGWDELGYHFVVGNGNGSADGCIEVGSRWTKQKWGAHAKTPDNRFNDYGIGICLVGNFDVDRPSARQLESLAKLTAFLMKTYQIPPDRVIGHCQTKPTDCPGRNTSLAQIREMAAHAQPGLARIQPAAGSLATSARLTP